MYVASQSFYPHLVAPSRGQVHFLQANLVYLFIANEALSRGTVVPLKQGLGGFEMPSCTYKVWEQLQDKHSEEMQNCYR